MSSLKKLKSTAGNSIKVLLRQVKYYGNSRYCPICEKTSKKFLKFGNPSRKDAQCPFCHSLERDRLVWLYLQKHTNFSESQGKSMLHIAPEAIFQLRFEEQIKNAYLTADLYRDDVMAQMDITNIQYPDNTFDIIYCSHVLEHVPDDIKAMSELHRVLSSNGWAIINVPQSHGLTQEDLSISDPELRIKLYGQEDHVRLYGTDYIDRLRSVEFQVECINSSDILSLSEIELMGVTKASGNIYFCTK